MPRPARLASGTAVAALTLVTLGLAAAPSAYAGDLGRLEISPSSARPGDRITVNTTACGKNGSGIGDANSLDAGDFDLYPGTHKEAVVGRFTVPHDTKPGTYGIAVSCDNGREATGDLLVTGGGGHHTPRPHPSGHVPSGIGGSVRPDTAQIAAGLGVIAAAGAGGVWMMRRRAGRSH
ncbi:hypothetical protein [uncultured Streptomyces sp.]|uniref:hypothetical protein n=1 Tax=uncultured Streptomyces sp. TaxID=174707 RepID=UPI0026036E6D|nr:hypothetical protein [uncultured Streptomyces sp.]